MSATRPTHDDDSPAPDPTRAYLHDKVVLITGAAGTVGAALVEACIEAGARAVRALDHGESELFFLFERVRGRGPVTPLLGDVRDLERLRLALRGVDVVLHAAALKHVELGEYNPFEVLETNLYGLNNVLRASLDAEVDRVIFTSSDKAVNPTNVMGASKMMGERLVTAANEMRGVRRTRFASVRFGNVLGSRGSVIPIFADAAQRGAPLTLTHPEMSRYVMTIEEAARLVLEAGSMIRGGEVFVTKMRAIKLADLAAVTIEELAPRGGARSEVTIGRPRAGEKLYEELLTGDEVPRALETERLLLVPPALQGIAGVRFDPEAYGVRLAPVQRAWNSNEEQCLTRDELRAYLRAHGILAPWQRA